MRVSCHSWLVGDSVALRHVLMVVLSSHCSMVLPPHAVCMRPIGGACSSASSHREIHKTNARTHQTLGRYHTVQHAMLV